MKKALVFPGQGSQFVGMGKGLADEYAAARHVFEEVDDALDEKLSDLIWNGDIQTLTLTRNAQPALMATSIAAVRALESEGAGLDSVSLLAGHSLGEYSALCTAGAMSLRDTARLLRIRGQAMQDAVPDGKGAMAAILGISLPEVIQIAGKATDQGVCEAANDNDPKQVVVSGDKAAVELAAEIARQHGARRVVILPVSAPFHCQLMQPAADSMQTALGSTEIQQARIPVVANVLAAPVVSPDDIVDALVRQVTGTVRWRESVLFLSESGVESAFEVGAGNVLSGLVRRTERKLACAPVGNPDQIRQAASSWNSTS